MQHQGDNKINSAHTLAESISMQRMIHTKYNGIQLRLAPHQLFVRNEALYLGAFNPEKKRRSDEAPSLGFFNVSGMSGVELSNATFEPIPDFNGEPPRSCDMMLVTLRL